MVWFRWYLFHLWAGDRVLTSRKVLCAKPQNKRDIRGGTMWAGYDATQQIGFPICGNGPVVPELECGADKWKSVKTLKKCL